LLSIPVHYTLTLHTRLNHLLTRSLHTSVCVLACRLIPTSCKLVRNLCSSSIVMQGVFITVSIASCILSLTRGSLCLHLLSQAVNQGDAYLLLSSNAFSHSSNTFSHSSNTFSHTFVHTCSVRRSIKAMHTRFFLAIHFHILATHFHILATQFHTRLFTLAQAGGQSRRCIPDSF